MSDLVEAWASLYWSWTIFVACCIKNMSDSILEEVRFICCSITERNNTSGCVQLTFPITNSVNRDARISKIFYMNIKLKMGKVLAVLQNFKYHSI